MLGLIASALSSNLGPTLGVTTLVAELKSLEMTLGKGITVAEPLSRDLVFVSGSRLKGLELLKAVASAVHASLITTNQGFRVERTREDSEDLEKERISVRVKLIDGQIANLRSFRSSKLANDSVGHAYTAYLALKKEALNRFLDNHGPFPETYFAEELLPSETLLESLIKRVGETNLASIPIGKTKIFEDLPVDGVTSLPKHQDLLDIYVRESTTLAGVTLPPAMNGKTSYLGKPGVCPSKLSLKVSSGPTTIATHLDAYDSNGARLTEADFVALVHNPIKAPPTVAGEAMADPNAKWVTVSDTAEASLASTALNKIGPKAPEWLLRPDKIEPLNLFASEVLNGMAAENPDRTTIVDVSDNFWAFAKIVDHNGRMCVSAFETVLGQCSEYERVDTPNAVIWRPKDPESIEPMISDRRVLARTAQSLTEDAGDSLREISVGYYKASPQYDPFVQIWYQTVLFLTDRRGDPLPPEPVCRLLGAISDRAWDELVEGRTLSLGSDVSSEDIWDLLVSDSIRPGGRPTDRDIQQNCIELYDRSDVGATHVSFRTESSLVVRSWLKNEDRTYWGDVSTLANIGPGHPVSINKPRDQWGRPEFETLMGDGRLFRSASAVDRVVVFSFPYGFHADFRCRVGYFNVSEPALFSDLPRAVQDDAWKSTEDAWTRALGSLKPTQPPITTGKPPQPW